MEKAKKARPSRFRRGLLFYFLALLAVGAVALVFLWFALGRYEAATPQYCIRQFLAKAAAGELEPAEPTGPFTDPAAYTALLQQQAAALPADPGLYRTRAFEDGSIQWEVRGEDGSCALRLLLTPREGGGWQAVPQPELLPPVTLRAPQGVQLTVNGRPLTADYCTGQEPVHGFEALGEEAPMTQVFLLEGLLAAPQITAQGPGGQDCPISGDAENGYQAMLPPTPEEAPALQQAAAKVTGIYAAFITEDATLTDLSAVCLHNTPFWAAVSTFYNHWYVKHDSSRIENLEFEQLYLVAPNAFCAELSFEDVILRKGKEDRFPARYHLCLLQTDSGWKLASLETL